MNDLLIRRTELDVNKTSYTRLIHYEWTYRPRSDLAPIMLALVASIEIDHALTTHRVFVFGSHNGIPNRDFTSLHEAFDYAYSHALKVVANEPLP